MKTKFEKWIDEHRYDPDYLWSELAMEITTMLQDKMEEKGMSVDDLAKKLDMSDIQVLHILNGGLPDFSVINLVRVARVLGLRLKMVVESLPIKEKNDEKRTDSD
jgi:ribosome-binding protein aMBF1 (putative translation factor)